MSGALEIDVPRRKRIWLWRFLWVGGITLFLVSLAVIGFSLFSSENSDEAKAPKQTEQDLEMQRLSSELLGVKSTANSALEKAEKVEKRQEEMETKMDSGFADLHRKLDSLDRKVEGYHKIPPRVSLPKSKPATASASSSTTRAAAPRAATAPVIRQRVPAPTSQNYSDFVSRREFQASIDTVYARMSRLGLANLAIIATLDSVVAKIGRLTSNAASADTTTRTAAAIRPAAPTTQTTDNAESSSGQRRHSY